MLVSTIVGSTHAEDLTLRPAVGRQCGGLPFLRAELLPAEAQVFDTRELAGLATVMLQMMLELYGGGCCLSTCLLRFA